MRLIQEPQRAIVDLLGERGLVPRDVLYGAERPVVFTTSSASSQDLLAYFAYVDEDDSEWTLLTPASARLIADLETGRTTVREALSASWLWLCRVRDAAAPDVWPVSLAEIPDSCLPVEGVPLLPEHVGVLVTRAMGENLNLGVLPASVVAFVADATRQAVKHIVDFLAEAPLEGRPTDEHRRFYDLPVLRMAHASFQLTFGEPTGELLAPTQADDVGRRLQSSLNWAAASQEDGPLPASTDDERAALLRAALCLTPPSTGAITEVLVSGTWLRGGPVRLSRGSRRKVRRNLKALEVEAVVEYEGRVGELDVDRGTFILRDTRDGTDRRGRFDDPDLRDDLAQALADGRRIKVLGLEREGKLYLLAMVEE